MDDRKIKILLIDDDRLVVDGIAFYLEEHGYEVITANNGQQGLNVFGQECPDIVITDLHMPKMDGFAVLDNLTNTSPDTPLIVCSGTGAISTAIEATRLGAWDLVIKPIRDMDAMLHAVSKTWERASLIKQNRKYREDLEQTVEERTRELKTEILEKTKAQQQLNIMTSHLDDIINSMPSILIGIDADEKITHWNIQASKVFDVATIHAMGKKLYDVLPCLGNFAEKISSHLVKQKINTFEKIKLDIKSNPHYFDLIIYPLQNENQRGAVLRMDDITTRIRLDEMMVQSEKMMSLGGLAAGMAHEINNPLSVVMQGAQTVNKRLFGDLPENIRVAEELGITLDQITEYADKRKLSPLLAGMKEAATRASKIITDMLNFSRTSESEKQDTNIESIIENSIQLASQSFDIKKNYDFRKVKLTQLHAPDLPEISCNPIEIQQVLLNLLNNAAHAICNQEGVEEKPEIIIRSSLQKDFITIQVEDNGPGIKEETIKHIFEPFYTTKARGIGTGLGLSVSYYIITKNHKGRLSVESTIGKGTVFTIELPR